MGLVTSVALIVCGVLAAAAGSPSGNNSQQMIDKLVPTSWIGLIVCFWGTALDDHSVGPAWDCSPISRSCISPFSPPARSRILPRLLAPGFALITKYALSKSPEAMTKGEQLRGKLVGIQIPWAWSASASESGASSAKLHVPRMMLHDPRLNRTGETQGSGVG